ncbi:hypothetical protein H6F77_12565 [Microcoleus sp. FACHB-831]|nr:hypothetical protein [Microcoleus sp. FACHB-831]MBD1921919.1 hypothetical protein [Microcoleus sp. FACHB-831]
MVAYSTIALLRSHFGRVKNLWEKFNPVSKYKIAILKQLTDPVAKP